MSPASLICSLVITETEEAVSAKGIGVNPPEMMISSSSNVSWATALVAKSDKMAADKVYFFIVHRQAPVQIELLKLKWVHV